MPPRHWGRRRDPLPRMLQNFLSESCCNNGGDARYKKAQPNLAEYSEYSKNRGLRTLCDSLLKCIRSQAVIAQGCEDADMCEVIDTCAKIEINHVVVQHNAHPCAMTPIRAILNKTKAAMWGALNAHPCAKTPVCAMLIKPHRTISILYGEVHRKGQGDAEEVVAI